MDIKTIVIEVSRLARWAEKAVKVRQPLKAKHILLELRELLDKEFDGKPSAPRVCGSEGSRT
jgi:hypothetical protein